MYCNKCGSQLNAGGKFCKSCGSEVGKQPIDKKQQLITQNQSSNNYGGQAPINTKNNNDINYNKGNKKSKRGLVVLLCGIGLIIGIFLLYLIGGLVFNFGPIAGFRTGLREGWELGLEADLTDLNPDISSDSDLNVDLEDSTIYYGDGYELKYNNKWMIGSFSGDKEALKRKTENSFMVPVGTSELYSFGYNFETEAEKKEVYDKLCSKWSTSVVLSNGSDGFSTLSGDIYYATVDYGASLDKISGKFYILVSKEDDIILTFMLNAKAEDINKNNEEVLEMLKEIKITGSSTSSSNNSESFTTGDLTQGIAEDHLALGYLDYKVPECWTYSEEKSASIEYRADVFKFEDGKTMLEARASSPMNMKTLETGKTYEEFKNDIKEAKMNIVEENTKVVNGVEWHHIVTDNYTSTNFNEKIRSEYYIAFSNSNSHIYMYHLYISSSLNSNDTKYLNDSMDYILNNSELHKYEE